MKSYNSQNLPLLQAPLNIDTAPNTGGAEILVQGGALVAQDSPAGGLAENLKDRPSSDQISVYVVRKGDTLSVIAQMFNVSVNTIRWANDLKGSVISEGQTLTILPVSGVRHVVKKGDTAQSISKIYKAGIDDILTYNDITNETKLAVGDVVIVPDGELVTTSATTPVRFVETTSNVASGYYMKPVPGRRTQGIHGHNGVDLASPVGTPIVAAAAGRVIISRQGGWNSGYGNYIVIEHPNGTQTLYSHNRSNSVSAGESVNKGQVIGYVGLTGKTTGPHLHFEVRGAKNPF